ncbi:LuxR C-terminal-related transcriptional regulator [Gemmata sp.]|uniref:LuxR C-terminal-related transcriptional regulator n=1 Tax=Gemmata sp. TaxID=1914242 RepID=UPI003F709630
MTQTDTPQPKLTARDLVVAALVASGKRHEDIAAELDCSRATISRSVAKPGFRAAVREIRTTAAESSASEIIEGAREAAVELRRLAREGLPNDRVRLAACRTIAELALRWHERLGVVAELDEVQQEINAMRERLDQRNAPSPPPVTGSPAAAIGPTAPTPSPVAIETPMATETGPLTDDTGSLFG